MKKIFLYILWFIYSINYKLYASNDAWILWNEISQSDLRTWDIHTEDIPNIIKWAIDFWMSIAWTIAVIFVIIWAYQILFGSIEQDKSKWKNTVVMAIVWFAIASLAWFIIKLIIDNLGKNV